MVRTHSLYTDHNISAVKHPGIVLIAELRNMGMSQKELSQRTGVTEKHISTIIKGKKGISVSFAKKLSYVLPISANDWLKMQADYDAEEITLKEINGITDNELAVYKELDDVVEYCRACGLMSKTDIAVSSILEFRKMMEVSNLLYINEIGYNAAYRLQLSNNVNVNPYILYAWQKVCELICSKQREQFNVYDKVDLCLLNKMMPEIKELMFEDINTIYFNIRRIFARCGVTFAIVPSFRGAPVQGFIKKNNDGKIIMCITLRRASADIFWFTLFHEIGHLMNGDLENVFVDFNSVKSDREAAADNFASSVLIDLEAYKDFVKQGCFSLEMINNFANRQNVLPDVVIGRLHHDEVIPWSMYSRNVIRYKWAEV